MSPHRAGALAAGAALVVAAVWFVSRRPPGAETVSDATVALQITKHDSFGAPTTHSFTRDPVRVHGILAALGVERLAPGTCPPDYATADVGILFTGRDVYARRNAYVWNVSSDSPNVVLVDSTGCRVGNAADAGGLRSLLAK